MADYNSLVNLYRTATKADEEEEKRKQNQIYDNQAQVIKDTYDSAIKVSETDYNELEREAEIQRLINKNEVAEDMANIGHRDSGLSRDQTAAVNIAASNQRAKISLARQQAKEAKMLEMKAKLAEIENNRLASDNTISSKYTKLASDNAAAYIKQEQEYAQKAAEEAAKKEAAVKDNLYHYRRTETDSKLNQYVVYSYNGKEVKFAKGVNPYNSNNNTNNPAVKKYGTFTNGYQPKGVYNGGVDYGTVKSELKFNAEDGRRGVNLWKTTKNGTHYWVWNGKNNQYEEVYYNPQTGEIRSLEG